MDKIILAEELARLFNEPQNTRVFLEESGFNLIKLKAPFGEMSSYEYWHYILKEIDNGTPGKGYNDLIGLALKRYPHNKTLKDFFPSYNRDVPNKSVVTGSSKNGKQYDVFISCNSEEGHVVDIIVDTLASHQITPWYYKYDVYPSNSIVNKLEGILNKIKAMAVLIGGKGKGPWQDMEISMAIDLYTKRRIVVIPVLLPGSYIEQMPLILRQFDAICLNSNEDTAKALAQALEDLL